jgi:hypothetical protein
LLSDGEANCQKTKEFPLSACDMVASLKNQKIDFTLDMIGYGNKSDKEFKCISGLSKQYSYTIVDSPQEATSKIEEAVDMLTKYQSFVEKLTEFLKSISALIAGVFMILVALGFSKFRGSGG